MSDCLSVNIANLLSAYERFQIFVQTYLDTAYCMWNRKVSNSDLLHTLSFRVASKEVTLQLIKVKCLKVLLYGLEACPLTKSDLQSLDFVINRFFMKLFTTKNIEIVKYCQEYFGFALPSVLWAKRVSKFESSFNLFFCLICNCVVLIVFVLFTLLPHLFGE